ncbi:hypothetical protein AWB99_20705 [Mycolicibacterium confluentis]|nr:hypothetical protein AWB99_20705 [Mycolicibacterium confluentis]
MIEISFHRHQPGLAHPLGARAGALTWSDVVPQILTASTSQPVLLKMSKRVGMTPVDSTHTGS